jgi:hypothetical protein
VPTSASHHCSTAQCRLCSSLAMQGTRAVLSSIQIRETGAPAQLLQQPPLIAAASGIAHDRSLSRTDSEAAGIQVRGLRDVPSQSSMVATACASRAPPCACRSCLAVVLMELLRGQRCCRGAPQHPVEDQQRCGSNRVVAPNWMPSSMAVCHLPNRITAVATMLPHSNSRIASASAGQH